MAFGQKHYCQNACLVKKHLGIIWVSTIKARTIIGVDVTTLAFIDDMTFGHLLSPGLVWAAQILCSQLCNCALQEISSNAGLGKGWCALFRKQKTQCNIKRKKTLMANEKVYLLISRVKITFHLLPEWLSLCRPDPRPPLLDCLGHPVWMELQLLESQQRVNGQWSQVWVMSSSGAESKIWLW